MKVAYTILLIAAGLFTACGQKSGKYTSPPGFDLSAPEKFNQEDQLLEISGISFSAGDSLFSIQDEDGKLFYGKVADKEMQDVRFHKGGDYEDVSVLDSIVIILRSDGTLFSLALADRHDGEAHNVKEWKDLVPKGEYEGMYADPATQKVYVLCKNCNADKKSGAVSGYVLGWTNGTLQQQAGFSLDEKAIQQLSDGKKGKIRPSALAKNPATGEWYILSSVNKLLVVAGADWQVKAVYGLNPKHYPQPEGIAFDSKGNLYISNEGDAGRPGNVLKMVKK